MLIILLRNKLNSFVKTFLIHHQQSIQGWKSVLGIKLLQKHTLNLTQRQFPVIIPPKAKIEIYRMC